MSSKISGYLGAVKRALGKLAVMEVAKIAKLLTECRDRGGKVLLAGNGGAAAICSHFANDLIKTLGIAAICLTDNVPTLTAYANDKGYGLALGEIADVLIRKEDVLFLMSTSGQSINILHLAFRFKNTTIALVGQKDCDLARWHKNIHFVFAGGNDARSNEDIFSVITHAIVDYLEEGKE